MDFVYGIIGLLCTLVVLGAFLYPIYAILRRWLWWLERSEEPRRFGSDRATARGGLQHRPNSARLLLAARANNRRSGCVLALSLALLFGLFLIGTGLGAGWESYDWFGRVGVLAYGAVGAAVLVLMLINFFKNAGFRAYDGQEVQIDDYEMIVDRSLIDSQTAGEDMFHPHLQTYLHKKYYYRIPLGDLKRITVSAMVYQHIVGQGPFPFVFLEFQNFDAVYMIQTRFMGDEGETRFLQHFESIGKVPLSLDERYAAQYPYLKNADVVRLD